MNTMKVSFTSEQFYLVRELISDYYDRTSSDYSVNSDKNIAYGAIIAMRLPIAEKAWQEYIQDHPDSEWRAYVTKEDFFRDQYTIYPNDLVTP